ncbi:MAG TPA: 50S ribosomal protein L25 [Luteibaculaceae bacterium]|nr:50S ribosomal protein L25 [Luteibaculaceae bacterium]
MKQISLSGSLRESVGKTGSKGLRNAGSIPAVIYGGEKPVHISIDKKELGKAIFTPDVYQVNLNIDGKVIPTIIKDSQFHPVTDEILHVDFLELVPNVPVKVKLPLRLIGQSRGVKAGGKLLVHFRKIDLKGIPDALPAEVTVDISALRIGQNIRVKDLASDKVTPLNDPNAVVVAVAPARGAAIGSDADPEEEA